MWQTDNGSEFRGDMIDGPEGLVEELIREKRFGVPNVKNSNPVPKKAWGEIQRGIRACHAHAEAPPACGHGQQVSAGLSITTVR